MTDVTSLLELCDISKRYGAVQALSSVSLTINEGDIHALVGENGAGKSTLGKIISGIVRPDTGSMLLRQEAVAFNHPRDALLRGVTTITQEIALLGNQTVLHNVLLGREDTRLGALNKKAMLQRYDEICNLTGFHIEPTVLVKTLRFSEQRKVEIMQAVARNSQIIVMDEPTAMLPDDDTGVFLNMVRNLNGMGYTIIYVSHFLEEVIDIAHRVTIMRNGRVIRTAPTENETVPSLIEGMLGQPASQMYPAKQFSPADAPIALEVRGLTSTVFDELNLSVRSGEIVGVAGLVGSGRSRLVRTIFGIEEKSIGDIRINGQAVTIRKPADAIKAGLHLLPESRKEQGLHLRQSIRHNMSLPHLSHLVRFAGVIRGAQEISNTQSLIQQLQINTSDIGQLAKNLSGGNQQKVLFGKWLYENPTVLMIDEPTRGVDVGAKQAIYEIITHLAQQGIGILMVSSEIEEILGLTHRVLVMRLGKIVAEFEASESTPVYKKQVMEAAFGSQETIAEATL